MGFLYSISSIKIYAQRLQLQFDCTILFHFAQFYLLDSIHIFFRQNYSFAFWNDNNIAEALGNHTWLAVYVLVI